MKTYKQFVENLSKFPREYDDLPVTIDDALFNRIRTLDTIKKSNEKFRSLYPFPRSMLDLVKKKTDIKTA